MKFTAAISTGSLFLCLVAGGAGDARAQGAGDLRNDLPSTSSSTTSTTTTTTVDPAAPVTPVKPKKPTTTNVQITPPPAGSDTTTRVQVDTPSDTPATTNIEVNPLPAAPPPKEEKSDNVVVVPIQTPPPPPAPAPIVTPLPESYPMEKPIAQKIGAALTVGGGVVDFTGSNARDMTTTGGYWNARIISGTRQFLGVEAAYVGSARDISALGLSNNAMLVSNGVEGALRLNVPIINGRSIFEPFAFAGMGWSRYSIARSQVNTSSVANDDDVMEVPYGAGLSFGYGGFLADARFTYRSTYYNDLLLTPSGTHGRLDNWSVGGQLGVEF